MARVQAKAARAHSQSRSLSREINKNRIGIRDKKLQRYQYKSIQKYKHISILNLYNYIYTDNNTSIQAINIQISNHYSIQYKEESNISKTGLISIQV
jgi:hypothetical protein